jgi:hypothetical protein
MPAVGVNAACFVNARPKVGAPMTVTGTGFPAGDVVGLSARDVSASVTVGAAGTFQTTVAAPRLSTTGPGSGRFTLTARDETSGATAATAFGVANLAFRIRPTTATPATRVRFSFSGFRPNAFVYGHYVLGRRAVASVRFGRARGSCGLLKARTRLFPGGHPRDGNYRVQFDDSRRYRPRSVPRIVSGLTIRPS